jgi:hypothetical protein
MVKFASVLNIEPFELFKPADAPPLSVSALFSKYNDEVLQAVSASLERVHTYYQAQIQNEPSKKGTGRIKPVP